MADDIIMLPLSVQCQGFICALALGAALSFVFSLFCAVQKVFSHKALQIAAEDICYCLVSAAATFCFFMAFSYGRPRWYILAGELLGWLLFWLLLGDGATRLAAAALGLARRAFLAAVSLVLLPLRAIFGFLKRNIGKFVCKSLKNVKKVCNNRKFCLKCHSGPLYNYHKWRNMPKSDKSRKEVSGVARRSKRKSSLLAKVVTLVFVICAAVSFIHSQSEVASKRRELAALDESIKLQQVENDEVRRVLDGGDDLEYIERIAREKLGYAYPDEKIFIDRSGG